MPIGRAQKESDPKVESDNRDMYRMKAELPRVFSQLSCC